MYAAAALHLLGYVVDNVTFVSLKSYIIGAKLHQNPSFSPDSWFKKGKTGKNRRGIPTELKQSPASAGALCGSLQEAGDHPRTPPSKGL